MDVSGSIKSEEYPTRAKRRIRGCQRNIEK